MMVANLLQAVTLQENYKQIYFYLSIDKKALIKELFLQF